MKYLKQQRIKYEKEEYVGAVLGLARRGRLESWEMEIRSRCVSAAIRERLS